MAGRKKKPTRGRRSKRGASKKGARRSTAKKSPKRRFLGHHVGYLFTDYPAARVFMLKASDHLKKGAPKLAVKKVLASDSTNYVVQVSSLHVKSPASLDRLAAGKK